MIASLRRTRSLLATLLAALISGSCGDESLTPPRETVTETVRAVPVNALPARFTGTVSVNSSDASGGVDLGTFDDWALVDITVSGLVTQHQNTLGTDLVFGPRGLPNCSAGYTITYGGTLAVLFPCPGADLADPSVTASAVVRGVGRADRSAGPTSCSGFPSPCFTYSGSQTVTVTEIPVTVTVRGDYTQAPAGTMITFTSTIVPAGMSFGGWWFFMDNGFTYQACPSSNRDSCTMQLFGPGHMEMYANIGPLGRVGTWQVNVGPPIPTPPPGGGDEDPPGGGCLRGPHGVHRTVAYTCEDPPPDPALDLKCVTTANDQPTISVVRGTPVKCTASVTPLASTAALSILSWTFLGNEGTQITRSGSDAYATTWEGPLVLGGQVMVTATVGTDQSPRIKTYSIAVTNRNWANLIHADFPQPTREPPPPRDFVINPDADSLLAHVELGSDYRWGVPIVEENAVKVPQGPNTDVYYLVHIPKIARTLPIHFNEPAFREGTDFFKAQKPAKGAELFDADKNCRVTYLTSSDFINKVLKHEGLNFDDGSHTQRYRAAIKEKIGPAVEPIVGTESRFHARWDLTMVPVGKEIFEAARRADQFNAAPLVCKFNYTYP